MAAICLSFWKLHSQGYAEYKSSLRRALDTQFARMYGKSGTTAEDIAAFRQQDLATRKREVGQLLDVDKIVRVKDGLQNRSNYGFTEGDAFIDRLLNDSTRDLMFAGKLSDKQFADEIRKGFAATVVSDYLPRNTSEFFKMATPRGARVALEDSPEGLSARLVKMAPDETPAQIAGTGRLVSTNRQMQRQGRQVLHLDDINALEGDFRALGIEPSSYQVRVGPKTEDVIDVNIFGDLGFKQARLWRRHKTRRLLYVD